MFLRTLKNRALVLGPLVLFVFIYSNYVQQRNDPLAYVATGDPEIAAARDEARATLPTFLARLQNPTSDESHFAVKFRLDPKQVLGGAPSGATSPQPAEFIWARDIRVVSNAPMVSGLIDGQPRTNGFRYGQPVMIALDDVVDWGYKKGGVVQGNFTTKVLLTKLPPDEAARARQVLGWKE